MDFYAAINIIKNALHDVGTEIDVNQYDGIVVKKLSASNTLEENRTTNQTHIAITGEQMDIFPYLCADGYFIKDKEVHGADLKKYFVISLNVTLFESNCRYLGLEDDSIIFSNGKVSTNTTVVRSKRNSQADQIQVSMLNMDGKSFVAFRKLLFTGYYLIILKCKSSMNYHIFGINTDDEYKEDFSLLNNKFYRLDTNTVVSSNSFNNSEDENNKEKFRKWMNSITKENGEQYSKRTIDNYIQVMESAYSKFDKYKDYESVFQIQDIDSLNEYTKYLYSADGFKEFNITSGNRTCSSGFEKYKEFLMVENTQIDNRPIAKGGFNKIFYGAPGCGKSRHVTDMLKEANVSSENIIRVTFHPEYANCDFIGQIMPTIEKDADGNDLVKYIFNPGPFSKALLQAYNTSDMVYLIVEEINRGNAAAIFGDMFQLLDRERDTENENYSASEYPISNPNMQDYLIKESDKSIVRKKLRTGVFIPSNLTIFATMNSSDQNVFTLDTAFKRRWNFEQISNDIENDNDHKYKRWFVPGTSVTWERFLATLNDKILDYKIYSQTNEDKRLGKYFVTKECLTEKVEDIVDVIEIAKKFAYKILEYVWNDVCKVGREEWFDTEKNRTLEDLIESFISPKDGETPLSIFQNINF